MTDNKLADAHLATECIREAISTFRLQYMLDQSDGSGLFLTDALAEYLGDDDIGRAREELDRLADSIYGDLAEHDSTSAAPDAPAPAADGAGALPPLPHGDAFCDIADWNEESIGMCGAWSEHLSINSRYTMPLYTESSVRTYARAAIAALRHPVAWQPIETAPKNRKLIVGYHNKLGNWRTVIGRYYETGTLESGDDDFSPDDGYAPEGWYEESESHETILRTDEPPTHWQPLPVGIPALASQQESRNG